MSNCKLAASKEMKMLEECFSYPHSVWHIICICWINELEDKGFLDTRENIFNEPYLKNFKRHGDYIWFQESWKIREYAQKTNTSRTNLT